MNKSICFSYDDSAKGYIPDSYYQTCSFSADEEHAQCCQPGSYCLTDGICQFDSNMSQKTSQYFAAECTDPTGKADVCKNFCRNSNTYTYVKWLGDVWQCCYGAKQEEGDCRNPIGEVFSAPPPAQLSTSTFLVNPAVAASVLATAIPPKVSSSIITDKEAFNTYIKSALKHGNEPSWFAAMPTAVQTYYVAPSLLSSGDIDIRSGSSNLGIKIGIPVAVAVILILLGIGLSIFCIRRRHATAVKYGRNSDDPIDSAAINGTGVLAIPGTINVEKSRIPELAGSPGRVELPDTPLSRDVSNRAGRFAVDVPNTTTVNMSGLVDKKRGWSQSEPTPGSHPAMIQFELDGGSARSES